jgi:ApbE superfamily uncharacterized protein (UPF0280 family)
MITKGRKMGFYGERTYRKRVSFKDLVYFHVVIKETDLWVGADVNLEEETRDLVFNCRHQLEMYIDLQPEFATTLLPYPEDPYAPPVVREMITATRAVGVGPMASVAGVIAQYIGGGLLKFTDQVIVENGGDIFLKVNRPATVSIFAGRSLLSEKFGLLIPVRNMPLAVCSSSAKVGHSLSMGIADVVCLLSSSAALADGAATAIGNRIKREGDLEKVAGWTNQIKGIIGGVVILEERMATWGDIELVEL